MRKIKIVSASLIAILSLCACGLFDEPYVESEEYYENPAGEEVVEDYTEDDYTDDDFSDDENVDDDYAEDDYTEDDYDDDAYAEDDYSEDQAGDSLFVPFEELSVAEQEALLLLHGYWFEEGSAYFYLVDDEDAHYSYYEQDDTGSNMWLTTGQVVLTEEDGVYAFVPDEAGAITYFTLSDDLQTLEGYDVAWNLSRYYTGPYEDPSIPDDYSYDPDFE